MLNLYRIFDITLASNLSLPELPTAPDTMPPDCEFRLHPAQPQNGTHEWFHEWIVEDEVTPWLSLCRLADAYLLRFPDLADFIVASDSHLVECVPAPQTPAATISHLFLNQVMPLALAQCGRWVLHASAVIGPQGQAWVFAAASGFGKSTLATYLAQQGYTLLTDDGVLITEQDGQLCVVPSYPGVRLWDDSLGALFGPATQSENYAHYTSKRRLALQPHGLPHAHRAVPLQCLYFLAEPDAAATAVRLTPLTPREVFLALVKHTFQLDITNQKQLKENFLRFTRLVSVPPAFLLDFPREWNHLPQVHEALLRHSREATPPLRSG